MLAYQAWDAARSHRAAAERALQDYAAFAVQEFSRRARDELTSTFVFGVLRPGLGVAPGPGRLPPPSILTGTDTGVAGRIRFAFSIDFRRNELRTTGQSLPDPVRRWVFDTLASRAPVSLRANRYMGLVFGEAGGVPRVLAYLVRYQMGRSSPPQADVVYGVEMAPEDVGAVLGGIVSRDPLLPSSVMRGRPNDSLLAVSVRDPSGRKIFRSVAPSLSALSAEDTLDESGGRLVLEVSVRPDAAATLVIGGLPRSRLPLLIGTIALTAVLVGTAIVQLRRDAEVQRLRSDFVSNVSHELRTPLAQIRMFAETLRLGRVRTEAEKARSLEIIDQEARRLTHLVENLLYFSRVERRAARSNLEPVDLGGLVREVAESFSPLAAARGVRLAVEAERAITVVADRDAARQIALNLLDNAVKYGPDGQTITIGARLDDGRARLWVDDQGPGIPVEQRERIWERFWRLERERASAVAGTGIGLAIVRELTAQHGGRAWVESAPGGGSRFVVELAAS